MKKNYILLYALVLICTSVHSQNLILNGSFENNTVSSNTLGIQSNWPVTVANSFEVDGGQMDLIMVNNCGSASDGNWYVTCSNTGGGWPYMAFSFKLSTILTQGAQYTLTFDKRYCGPNTSPIDIGISNDSTLMGTSVHTFVAPLLNTWAPEMYIFQAPIAARYLTVNVGVAGGTGTVGLDNFSLQAGMVGINEYSEAKTNFFPNPSNGLFKVTLPFSVMKSELEIFNLLGERIFMTSLQKEGALVDISKQPDGIYFYKISHSSGKTEKGEIVISR